MMNICEESVLKSVRVFKKNRNPEDPETSKALVVLCVADNAKTLEPTADSSARHHVHVQQMTQSQVLVTREFVSFDAKYYFRSRETIQDMIDVVVNSDLLSPEANAKLGSEIAAYILTRFEFSMASSMIMIIVEVGVTRIVSCDTHDLEALGGKQVEDQKQGYEYEYSYPRIEEMSGYLFSSQEVAGEEEKDSSYGDRCRTYTSALRALIQFLNHQESMGAPEEFEEIDPVMEIQEFKGDDDGWLDGCPICLEGFTVGVEVAKVPCNHTFHKTCVFKWLVKSSQCPMCRSICVALV